MDLHKI